MKNKKVKLVFLGDIHIEDRDFKKDDVINAVFSDKYQAYELEGYESVYVSNDSGKIVEEAKEQAKAA